TPQVALLESEKSRIEEIWKKVSEALDNMKNFKKLKNLLDPTASDNGPPPRNRENDAQTFLNFYVDQEDLFKKRHVEKLTLQEILEEEKEASKKIEAEASKRVVAEPKTHKSFKTIVVPVVQSNNDDDSEDEGNIFDYSTNDDFNVNTRDVDQEEEMYEEIFLGKLGQPQVLDIRILESNDCENM
ncbi:7528_t:CDS:2, partial [Gigaspora rosea]